MLTVEFSVKGESMEDPGHFLLVDTDGQYYDYEIATGLITPIEVDATWAVDPEPAVEVPTDSERHYQLAS